MKHLDNKTINSTKSHSKPTTSNCTNLSKCTKALNAVVKF